ncbi:MAG: MarR family transcriptional regulator [Thiothrix sp.]|nr:MarR family transcriptional regulator [Thiothrix sp.]HPQ97780.1 MarR family transcriptional regulator [Thiolinea sp.]
MSPTASDALSKQRLRLWLHLLRTTRSIEADLREFLRVAHQTTLPRFDVMAALYRSPEPQTMTELSRHLLVSNGNITTVVDRLVKDGLARREPHEHDRRSLRVSLTVAGLDQFAAMAAGHEQHVNALFAGLDAETIVELNRLLQRCEHPDAPMGALS